MSSKLSDLNPIPSALAGVDLFYVAKGGASYKATGSDLLTFVGGSFVPFTGAATTVNLNTQLLTAGTLALGKSSVSSRQLEIFSSTGIASLEAKTSLSSSYGGLYALADSGSNYAGMIMTGTTFTPVGVIGADSPHFMGAGVDMGVMNRNPGGTMFFAIDGNTITDKLMIIDSVGVQITKAIKLSANGTSTIGYVPTATDANGNWTWQAGGGTPALTATQIAYGDGSNAMTSSSGLTFTAASATLKISGSNPVFTIDGTFTDLTVEVSGYDAYYSTNSPTSTHIFRAGSVTQVLSLSTSVALFSTAVKIVDGTQANGYVLTSDAAGLASWQPAALSPISVLQKTANYTYGSNDETVEATGSNSWNLTLPTAVGRNGKWYHHVNNGTGSITLLTTSSQTVNGNASGAIIFYSGDNASFQSNGTDWIMFD